ncbi:transposase [Blastococcus sp. BMG 814]|uniref:Transposase n=1 Tax=Blastococcus carthaginiensis TaxID=3050034 RepID=A0ABT9I7M2_9ACTN|nr:transposase [Blastococcus carthaginiensis]MDP5181565.1 transposase [Blastococcus carthaginiensis]
MGRVSKYPEEFRRQAAARVLDGGRGVRDVARGLDLNHETLRNWVAVLRAERAAPGGPVSADERAELARLRRRVAELELERKILRRPRSSRQGDGAVSPGETFAFIAADKTAYGVRRLHRVLGVSKTAFYDWVARGGGPSEAELAEAVPHRRAARPGPSIGEPMASAG